MLAVTCEGGAGISQRVLLLYASVALVSYVIRKEEGGANAMSNIGRGILFSVVVVASYACGPSQPSVGHARPAMDGRTNTSGYDNLSAARVGCGQDEPAACLQFGLAQQVGVTGHRQLVEAVWAYGRGCDLNNSVCLSTSGTDAYQWSSRGPAR